MNILLINPEYPYSYWSFKKLLSAVSKKALQIPLGLITAAALLPESWNQKLIDLNVEPLKPSHLKWANYVFITGLLGQKKSIQKIIKHCRQAGVKTVAGGPYFTMFAESFPDIDHLILFEAETNLPPFLQDLSRGTPKHCYASQTRPTMQQVPVPRWDLLRQESYVSMSLQFSRGCAFRCEFCSVHFFTGSQIRMKTKEQVLTELETLYRVGWRGNVTFVDDNFINNPKHMKLKILPAIIAWMQQKKYPFSFYTHTTIDLADDDHLMDLMIQAGFDTVFVGIESLSESSLKECSKKQNLKRDLQKDINHLLRSGFQVTGGFIVGFDHDTPAVFKHQTDFIQASGLMVPAVHPLTPSKGTRLFERLLKEKRLPAAALNDSDTLFIPQMGLASFSRGYRQMVELIFSPPAVYARLEIFFSLYHPRNLKPAAFRWDDVRVLLRCIWMFGVCDQGRNYFWKLLARHWKTPWALSIALGSWMMGASIREFFKSPEFKSLVQNSTLLAATTD